jgi:hypothetical protein
MQQATTLYLSYPLDGPTVDEFHEESVRQFAQAERHEYERATVDEYGTLVCARKNWYGPPGPAMERVHNDPRLLAEVEAATGTPVFPTRSSYIYYEPGDFIGLHVDFALCRYTLLARLTARPDPLFVCPSLRGLPVEAIRDVCDTDYREHGQPVQVPVDGFLLLRGSATPHFRPPAKLECRTISLCFDAL